MPYKTLMQKKQNSLADFHVFLGMLARTTNVTNSRLVNRRRALRGEAGGWRAACNAGRRHAAAAATAGGASPRRRRRAAEPLALGGGWWRRQRCGRGPSPHHVPRVGIPTHDHEHTAHLGGPSVTTEALPSARGATCCCAPDALPRPAPTQAGYEDLPLRLYPPRRALAETWHTFSRVRYVRGRQSAARGPREAAWLVRF